MVTINDFVSSLDLTRSKKDDLLQHLQNLQVPLSVSCQAVVLQTLLKAEGLPASFVPIDRAEVFLALQNSAGEDSFKATTMKITCNVIEVCALMRLTELCTELHLDRLYDDLPVKHPKQVPAFDGFSLLLLTTPKLEFFLSRFRHGARAGTAAQHMARIKKIAHPLRLAYEEEPPGTRMADPEVPDELHCVERVDESAALLDKLVRWEAIKEGVDGDALTRPNVATCCYYGSVGKTAAALRAANPTDADLAAVDALINECQPHAGYICRALACLRVPVTMMALGEKGTGDCQTADAAVARACWVALQRVAKDKLHMDLAATSQPFRSVAELLEAMRTVLGPQFQLFLHIDDVQCLRDHGKPGQWFDDDTRFFEQRVSPVSKLPLQSEHREAARTAVIQEMGANLGLRAMLSRVIRGPGTSLFLTGRTKIPYLLGRSYLDARRTPPGETFAHLLPPLSAAGVLMTAARTICSNGQIIMQALGFVQGVVDELVQSESRMHALRGGTKRKGQGWSEAGHAKRQALETGALGRAWVYEAAEDPESEAVAGNAQDNMMPVTPGLSEGARRLVCFAHNVPCITGGKALLVRRVLQEAVSNAAYYKWATRSEDEINAFFCDQQSAICMMIADKKRSVEHFRLMDLTDAEQQKLIEEVMVF